MGIIISVKWILKQYTLRIVLILLVVLLSILYIDYLSISKEYILHILPQYSYENVKQPVIEGKTFNQTNKSSADLQITTTSSSVATTITTLTNTSKEKVNQDDTPHVKIFDLNGPIEPKEIYDSIMCRKSAEVFVNTTLCFHDLSKDKYVSSSIKYYGIWERHVIVPFMQFIKNDSDLLVLDVGAQVGQYSLFPASLGRYVLTVEPFIDNIYRLHKAAKAESIQNKITLIQNAVSNKRNEIKLLQEASGNIGGQSLLTNKDKTFNPQDREKNKYLVETILLDDIVPYLPKKEDGTPHKKAIMKIDIEGFEPYAFQHASKLFDTLDIQIIFMEWSRNSARDTREMVYVLQLVMFLRSRGYQAYDLSFDYLGADISTWPIDIIWKR